MNIHARRTLAVASGLLVPLLLFGFAVVAGFALSNSLNVFRKPSEIAETYRVYRKFGDAFATFSYVGLCLAGGACVAAMLWDAGRRPRLTTGLFWLLLLVILPMNVANYSSADAYNSRGKQALLDIAIVIAATICTAALLRLRTASVAARSLQAVAVFFLVMEGIGIPAIYAILWFLNAQRALQLADTRSFTPSWISALASVGALAVSILNHRRPAESLKGNQLIKS